MKLDIARAWKDEAYRMSLSEEQLRALPANPAGELELSEADLKVVYGGNGDKKTLINLIKISNISVQSINLFASVLNQTCFQER